MDDMDTGMGLRVLDTMCLSPNSTTKVKAVGYMLNSQGVTVSNCWGKKARWMDYSGLVEEEMLGIAMFNHPDNRARRLDNTQDLMVFAVQISLVKRYFEKLPYKYSGNYSLRKGQSITFKYRLYWYAGKGEAKKIEAQYRQWVAAKGK